MILPAICPPGGYTEITSVSGSAVSGTSSAVKNSAEPAPTPAGPVNDRVSISEKGSLLIFPKVEIRWDVNGNLLQDTFLDMTNDYTEDVLIQMYFVNGDLPLPAAP